MTQATQPIVVGLYGVSASGKTHLLHELKKSLGTYHYSFTEGAQVIAELVPGGLECFKRLSDVEKTQWREQAIHKVQQDAIKSGRVAVVTGHFLFWDPDRGTTVAAWTPADGEVYTHIIYLNTSADIVAKQSRSDNTRDRPQMSVLQIAEWQKAEVRGLRGVCSQHEMLFTAITQTSSVSRVSQRLEHFRVHDEPHNSSCAISRLDAILKSNPACKTVLALDADKTLAPEDAGSLVWTEISTLCPGAFDLFPHKALFSGSMGYSYKAFCQAMLLNEDADSLIAFDSICTRIGHRVQLHQEVEDFLTKVCSLGDVEVIIITCGPLQVWKTAISKLSSPGRIHIMGGSLISDGYVMTPELKGELVSHIRGVHNKFVYAMGDSPLDLDMLERANRALVAVPKQSIRSRSMDAMLLEAVNTRGLVVQQILLPDKVTPRLDTSIMPVTDLVQLLSVLTETGRSRIINSRVVHLTDSHAAKLLMTKTRDNSFFGPELRKAHEVEALRRPSIRQSESKSLRAENNRDMISRSFRRLHALSDTTTIATPTRELLWQKSLGPLQQCSSSAKWPCKQVMLYAAKSKNSDYEMTE